MKDDSSSSAPRAIAHGIVVGILCGLLAVVQSIGFGSLLTSGSGIALPIVGISLVSAAVVAAVTPVFSSTPGVVGMVQSVPAAALAGIVVSVVSAMEGATNRAVVVTALAAIAVTTLVVGITSLALGLFRLGRFVRFLPFPVIGGFLAGSGWLIVRGGFEVVSGASFSVSALLDPGLGLRIAVTAGALMTMVLLTRIWRHRLAMPTAVAITLVCFNCAVLFLGVPTDTLDAGGWTISAAATIWPPVSLSDLSAIDTSALLAGAAGIPTVAILTVLALLMNTSGLELERRRDIDVDRELSATGAANIASGFLGGLPGFHSVSLTLLAYRLGTHTNIVGLTVAATCLATLILGDTLLRLLPTPLLGAMLFWIGGSLMVEWLVRSHGRLPRWEYGVVVLIFVTIAFAGFAWGILTGLVATALLFAVEYGRVDIVRLLATGKDYHSSVDTSEQRREALLQHGDAILIIRLHGFLFFGTADRLRKRIEARAVATDGSVRFVVIDFRRVTGLDSSTVLSFIRLSQTAERERLSVVLTSVPEQLRAGLLRGGLAETECVRFVRDFDAGIKWCEDRLVAEAAPLLAATDPRSIASQLAQVLGDAEMADAVAAYCERLDVSDGEPLIEQGTPSDDIFFVESGHAAVVLASGRSTTGLRLATLGPGALAGEIAFTLGEPRSASVVADEQMVVWRFSRSSLDRLQAERPEVAARFHQGIAAMLARRLTRTNHLVRLLAD